MAGSTGSSPRPRKRAELDELQDLGDWANIDTFEWDETDVTLSTAEGLRWLQSIGIVSRDVSLVSAHLLISKCTIALYLSLSLCAFSSFVCKCGGCPNNALPPQSLTTAALGCWQFQPEDLSAPQRNAVDRLLVKLHERHGSVGAADDPKLTADALQVRHLH